MLWDGHFQPFSSSGPHNLTLSVTFKHDSMEASLEASMSRCRKRALCWWRQIFSVHSRCRFSSICKKVDELLAFRYYFLHFFPSRKLLIFGGRLYFLEHLGYSYCILPLKYGSTGLDRHLGWGHAESILGSGEPKPRFILTYGWTSHLHSLMSHKNTNEKGNSFLRMILILF